MATGLDVAGAVGLGLVVVGGIVAGAAVVDLKVKQKSSRKTRQALDLQVGSKAYRVLMGATYRIAEVADRSGFTASTLRYYEELGLVPAAGRTAAGYRLYDDSTLARLAFIARAKQLGCSLDEITDLAVAWEGERCEPVQARLRELVEAKIADARDRIADMVAFTAQLQEAAAALGRHTPDGPCDDECGCAIPAGDAVSSPSSIELTAKSHSASDPPIACTLAASEMRARREAWEAALAPVIARAAIDNGLRLVFPTGASLGQLAELVAAEQECCTFFRFAITVDGRGAALEVTAPAEAIDLVYSLFGPPA
jgi:DNA-binding transcriptional MerR regulator